MTRCITAFLPSHPWVFHLSSESEALPLICSSEHSTLEHSTLTRLLSVSELTT
jgi:hypothetical protein